MANTTLAYYTLKPPASIMSGRIRHRRVSGEAAGPVDRRTLVFSPVSLAFRVLASLAIVLLAGAAQAQRPTAATHVVRPGETLGLIAQHYGVDIFTLASANGIRDAHRIYSWQQLTIPPGAPNSAPAIVAQGRHIVRPGETLDSIAKQYGIDLSDLISLNKIFGWIYPGDELALPVAGGAPTPVPTDPPVTAAADSVTHIVRVGDSLGEIAQAYGVSLYDLQAANNIWTRIIFVGQELTIPPGGTAPTEFALPAESVTHEESPAPVKRVEASGIRHKVQLGESLAKIAEAYGVTLYDLQTLNDIWTSIVYVGQEIEIPAGGSLALESALPAQGEATDERPAESAPEPEPTVESSGITHRVRFGESLAKIANAYGVSLYDLQTLNDIWTSIVHVGQEIKIPVGGTPPVESALPAQREETDESPAEAAPEPEPAVEASGITHKVQLGESLAKIANAYGVSLYDLQTQNDIWTSLVYVGQEIEIPAGGSLVLESALPAQGEATDERPAEAAPEPEPAVESSGITHKVQLGESLAKIAEAYGVSLYDLQTQNDIWTSLVYVGQEIEIPAGGTPPVESALPAQREATDERPAEAAPEPEPTVESSGITHKVQLGESLAKIAEAYGVSLYDLQTLNDIWTSLVYVGQELEIPAGGSPVVESAKPAEPADLATTDESPAPESAVEASGITHRVRFGESMAKIAAAYGVSLYDLQTLNDIWTSILYVGQELEIPAGGSPVVESAKPAEPATPEESPAPEAPEPAVEASGITHRVKVGESLSKIAVAYGVSLLELQALNDHWTSILYVGQELEIPAGGRPPQDGDVPPASEAEAPPPTQASTSPQSATFHTVRRGESLFGIANQYGISLDALIRANGIEDVNRIHAGNKLRVSRLDAVAPPAASNEATSPAPAQAAPPAAPAGRALPVLTTRPAPGVYPAGELGQLYTVGRGEYLTELGVRFNMEWRVLAEINGISPPAYAMHPGQTLRIPSFVEYLSYLPDNSNYKLFYTTNHHPGPRVGVGREIVIELGRQSIYAYENGVLKKRALMSSGKMITPTVLGDYEIYRKYRSQTMSGPGYSLDNVEWPMYFYAGYAIHGTWWHTMFGTPMSHGCVNLTNADAQWFWEFAPLGTPVHVRH